MNADKSAASDDAATEQQPEAPQALQAAGAPEPGSWIGDYRIREELGRGGMGVVYLAEQVEPVQRTVALKLMQEALRTPRAEALFQIECQALAQMEHPGIAKVFDAGRTADGHPWFAMERIDGCTLGEWLEREQPDRTARLALFVAICQGVNHAHQKGVIHRDLKLGNIMITVVDGRPQPKIIDFGLALGVRGGRRSVTGGGTRDYMSPEQRSGSSALDIRTDVYALGVVLLKLLAPKRFFELREQLSRPTSLPELLDRSLQAPRAAADAGDGPLDASVRCLAEVDSELRWALRRALAIGREQRYGSALAFGEDIQAFLDHRPLQAVPDSRRYRVAKFVRRHRPVVYAAAAALLFLLVGAIAATLGFVHAERQRQRAEAALDRARIESAKAQRVSAFLEDLLGGVSPDVARGMDTTLLQMLLRDATQRASRELAAEPEVLASVEATMAATYAALGDYPKAEALARHARGLLAPAAPLALKLAARLAQYEIDLGREAEGVKHLEQALAALQAAHPADHPDLLATRSALAWYRTYVEGSSAAASRDELAALLPRMRAALGADHHLSLVALHRLAILESELEHGEVALALFDELVERRTRTLGPEHADTLNALNSQGIQHLQRRDYARGAELLGALLPRAERVYGRDHEMTLAIAGNLAGALRKSGQLAASGPHYRRAYEGMVAKFGADDRRSLMFQSNLGNYLWQSGQLPEAERLQRDALAGLEQRFGADHPMTSETRLGLGRTLTALGRKAEARPLLERVLRERRARLPAGSAEISDVEQALAATD